MHLSLPAEELTGTGKPHTHSRVVTLLCNVIEKSVESAVATRRFYFYFYFCLFRRWVPFRREGGFPHFL